MSTSPKPRPSWILGAILISGGLASQIAPQIWLARNMPVAPSADPDFAKDLGCQVVQLCGTPHQSLTLKVGDTVTVEPSEGAPPGWLDCAARQVANYHGIGDVPINPCK